MLAYSSQPFLLQDRLIIFIAFSQIFVTLWSSLFFSFPHR